jgi:hypothetical protein
MRIRFRGLALFVNRPNGLSVCFPQQAHEIKVRIDGSLVETPNGHRVVLTDVKTKKPYNEPTLRASVPLLHIDSISDRRLRLREEELAMPVWQLGGGKLIALRARAYPGYEYWADYNWSFGEYAQQTLTDTVDFVLDQADRLELTSERTGQSIIPPEAWKERRQLEIEVHNEDVPPTRLVDSESPFELAEMRALYSFFGNAPDDARRLPTPKATAEAYAYFKRNKDNWTEPGTLSPACEKPFCPGMQAEGDPR